MDLAPQSIPRFSLFTSHSPSHLPANLVTGHAPTQPSHCNSHSSHFKKSTRHRRRRWRTFLLTTHPCSKTSTLRSTSLSPLTSPPSRLLPPPTIPPSRSRSTTRPNLALSHGHQMSSEAITTTGPSLSLSTPPSRLCDITTPPPHSHAPLTAACHCPPPPAFLPPTSRPRAGGLPTTTTTCRRGRSPPPVGAHPRADVSAVACRHHCSYLRRLS